MSRGPAFWGNLARRLGTAAVAIPALLLVLFKAPPRASVLLVAIACALGLWEFWLLLTRGGVRPFRAAGAAVTALFFMETLGGGDLSWTLGAPPFLPLTAVVLLTAMLARAPDLAGSVPAAAATLLGAAYLGSLGGAMAALRTLPPDASGAWRLTLLLAIIMTADTLAFAAGSAFGRHKLAPRISPGKTVEGLGGGLVGGVIGALVVQRLGLAEVPVWHAVALGALVAGAGVLGDLVESLLKRWAGVKDSGSLFPGHGGMLDRLDSLLFGAPVLYYYFHFLR